MAKKRTDERNDENVEGEEPNFDDPEDFVDDISEEGGYWMKFRNCNWNVRKLWFE